MSVQWPRTTKALPSACRYFLLDGNLAGCLRAAAWTDHWTKLLFFTTSNECRERLHWKSLPTGTLTKDLTSRIRWHSSSLGSSREAPWSRVAPQGRISCCPWKPRIRWCCRKGASSWWRESSRNSGIGVLTSWWIDRLLSRWLKHKNGMSVCLLTAHQSKNSQAAKMSTCIITTWIIQLDVGLEAAAAEFLKPEWGPPGWVFWCIAFVDTESEGAAGWKSPLDGLWSHPPSKQGQLWSWVRLCKAW